MQTQQLNQSETDSVLLNSECFCKLLPTASFLSLFNASVYPFVSLFILFSRRRVALNEPGWQDLHTIAAAITAFISELWIGFPPPIPLPAGPLPAVSRRQLSAPFSPPFTLLSLSRHHRPQSHAVAHHFSSCLQCFWCSEFWLWYCCRSRFRSLLVNTDSYIYPKYWIIIYKTLFLHEKS